MSLFGKIGIAAAAIFTIAVVAGLIYAAIWINRVESVANLVVPTPVMPKPNAFDDFVAAGNEIVEPDQIVDCYRALGKDRYPNRAETAFLHKEAPALKRIRLGLRHTYWNPPVRAADTSIDYYATFRSLAMLLSFEGRV